MAGLSSFRLNLLSNALLEPYFRSRSRHEGLDRKCGLPRCLLRNLARSGRSSPRSSVALTHTTAAGAVALFSAVAGGENHLSAARRTGDEAGQRERVAHGSGPNLLGIAGLEGPLDLIEVIGGDDWRHRDPDAFPDLVVAIAPVVSLLDGVAENPTNLSRAPFRSLARPVAMIIEPLGDPLDAHRAA